MKNTKVIFSGIMAAILATGAANAATGIASVDYVDAQKTSLQTSINGKADKATTLAGYGIEDAYTKDEVDDQVSKAVAGDMSEALKGYVTTSTYNAQVGDVQNLEGETKIIVSAINEVRSSVASKADAEALNNLATKDELKGLGDTINNYGNAITNLTNQYGDLADAINGEDGEDGLAAQVETNTTNIATNTTNIASNTAALANKANTADLTALATSAPGECSNPANKCVITWDGTNYGVEVIVRGAAE